MSKGSCSTPPLVAYSFSIGLLGLGYRLGTKTTYAHPVVDLSQSAVKGIVVLFIVVVVIYAVRRLRDGLSGQVWTGSILITVACIPFLEIEHLTELAAIPVLLLISGLITTRQVLLLAGSSALSNVASVEVGGHESQAISLVLALGVATAAYLTAQPHVLWAVFSFGYVTTAAPGFLNFTAQWVIPMSTLHAFLGGVEYSALFLYVLPLPFAKVRAVRAGRVVNQSTVVGNRATSDGR